MRIDNTGISTLEMALSVIIIAVLVSGFGTLLYSTVTDSRTKNTLNQLDQIKKAIVGEPKSVPPGEKSLVRHGYLGDMGSLPAALSDLEAAGTQPDYAVDSILQLGAGWRGPYVSSGVAAGFTDAWSNGLVYSTTAGTSSVTGAAAVASIRSIGPDSVNGTADDHVVEIYKSETFAQVSGFVKDSIGQTMPGVNVKLTYPTAGVIPGSPAGVLTDSDGLYTFAGVPHGIRVLQLEPKLSYQRGTAYTTGNDRNNLEVVVENLGKTATNVSTLKISYTSNPVSDFQQVIITTPGGSNLTTGGGVSGTTVSFTATTVGGTGVIQEPLRVDITGLVMSVPDAVVGTVGTGQTLKIQMNDFEEVSTNNNVDVTGVTFTLEFSDGSKTLFVPVRK